MAADILAQRDQHFARGGGRSLGALAECQKAAACTAWVCRFSVCPRGAPPPGAPRVIHLVVRMYFM